MTAAAAQEMSRQERLILSADTLQRLELTGHAYMSLRILTYIKRYDAYRVTSHQILVTLSIIQGKGKNTVQSLKHTDKILLAATGTYSIAVQRQDNLTVTAGTERVSALILTAYSLMVVNLTVNGQHLQTVLTEQRLTARLGINYTQTLMSQDGRATAPDTAPVGTAMTYPTTHFQCLLSELL
jgi:hypothetical protein